MVLKGTLCINLLYNIKNASNESIDAKKEHFSVYGSRKTVFPHSEYPAHMKMP